MQKLLAAGVNVFLPRIMGDGLQFYQITNLVTDLEFNQRYGLYETQITLPLVKKMKLMLLLFRLLLLIKIIFV